MRPVARHETSVIDFVENAARLRAAFYREEGDRFRTMAEVERNCRDAAAPCPAGEGPALPPWGAANP